MVDDYRPGSMNDMKVASSIRFIKENTFEKNQDNSIAIWSTASLTANGEGADLMKLGSASLALISFAPLVDRFPDIISRDLLKQIGNSIIHFQRPDGEFHSLMYRDGSFEKGWKSLFYPGQAIFGLFELYRITEEKNSSMPL
jgi:prenyltransferase beta subunit